MAGFNNSSTLATTALTDQRSPNMATRSARQYNALGRLRFAQLRTPQQVTARTPEISFQFRLNPTALKVTYKKLQQYVYTKFGHERQYWGNNLFVFSYRGSSEVFQPQDPSMVDYSGRFDITQTPQWVRFRQFEKFFIEHGEQNVEMTYWGYPYSFVGSLDDFSFDVDSEKEPRRIMYSFVYTAIPITQPDVLLEYNPTADVAPRDLPQLDAGTPGPVDTTRIV